jgi:predicted Fe-S protein YdhL (DUF1289 family)
MINFESPCVSLCELDEAGENCIACKRTQEEIFSWMTFTQEERNKIMKDVETRPNVISKD